MIQTKEHRYSDEKQSYQGVIAYDDTQQGKRPVVLVAHAWMGQSQFEEDKATALAQLGYLAFAIDVYGEGKRANDASEAESLMNAALAGVVEKASPPQTQAGPSPAHPFADFLTEPERGADAPAIPTPMVSNMKVLAAILASLGTELQLAFKP